MACCNMHCIIFDALNDLTTFMTSAKTSGKDQNEPFYEQKIVK